MKFKRLLFSISAALALLISPSSSLAGWGGGWHGGGGRGWHGGWHRGWHGGWHGGWWHGGYWHGGNWYRWGWWPGYGWGWWGAGGWYPYSAWGDYPYGYYAGGDGGDGQPPGAQDETSAIQSRLANLGFYHGAIDGKVGSGTESALKAFQAQHGLKPSGQIDDETLNALGLGQEQ
jgi:Putative peptidoglycan binding domain